MRGVVGVLAHPRRAMADAVRRPTFVTAWLAVLMVAGLCGALLLSTEIGQQALVDERVRVIEGLGGRVDDATYEGLQARPPFAAYAASGGRMLLTPPVTLLVALGLVGLARIDGHRLRYVVGLSIAVHAGIVLAVQQVLITPVHLVRESLTSPTTIGGLFPIFDEGTWAAHLLGTIDVFGLWWVWLMGMGLAAATGRTTGHSLVRLALVYVGIAAIVAGVFAVMGVEGT